LVKKTLPVAGILEDIAWGSKIVRKMNSWPRSEAPRATMEFEDNLSAKGIYL